MAVFFNGQLLTTPTTASAVNDDALANQNLTVGNVLAIVGSATGGQPDTALTFGSPSEARAVLRSGELCDAVVKAFSPSDEVGGPSSVIAIRVDPALQSTLILNDSTAAAAINLTSADYGAWTKQIAIKIQPGSLQGIQATAQYGSSFFTQDNLYETPFDVQYTGAAASATMTITGTSVVLSAPTGTVVSTIDLTQFTTVAALVSAINVVPGFSAAILNGDDDQPALNGLDYVAAQDVKTALYTATANLQAVINWFNSQSQSYAVATRAANAGKPPAPIPFTYMAGGTDGTITNTQWGNAFTALQTVTVQVLGVISPSPSIIAMADAHVQFMSTAGRKERRAFCGIGSGSTDAAGIAAALAINSDRTSVMHLGYYDFDVNGNLVLKQPYMAAAVIAAAFAGVSPGTPLTNKSVTFRGIERVLQVPTETDPLINGGVLCVEKTDSGYFVVKSISSWLVNDNYDKVEQSTGAALDFVCANVRNALDVLRGAAGTPQDLARAVSIADSALRQLAKPVPQGPGVIVGDAANPAYKNITASLQGDVISVQFQCSPVIPINYVLATIYAVPFSGTASVASSATPSS